MKISYNDLFYYSENSKTGLKWKIDKIGANGGVLKRKDKDAGCFVKGKKGEKKCINVNLRGKIHKVHRIIWELLVGSIPDGMVIDHLNGNPWDNRIENLSCKSQRHNLQNSIRNFKSNTGIKGVRLATMNDGKNFYIEARVFGQKLNKYSSIRFSLEDFSYEDALEKATAWRRSEMEKLNGNGEQYTERHIDNDTEQN